MQQSVIPESSATSSAMSITERISKDSMAEGISSCDILNRLTKTIRDYYGLPVVVSCFFTLYLWWGYRRIRNYFVNLYKRYKPICYE